MTDASHIENVKLTLQSSATRMVSDHPYGYVLFLNEHCILPTSCHGSTEALPYKSDVTLAVYIILWDIHRLFIR